jgi:hypothetical protein
LENGCSTSTSTSTIWPTALSSNLKLYRVLLECIREVLLNYYKEIKEERYKMKAEGKEFT